MSIHTGHVMLCYVNSLRPALKRCHGEEREHALADVIEVVVTASPFARNNRWIVHFPALVGGKVPPVNRKSFPLSQPEDTAY